jgi:hypothetical protein
MAAPADSTIRTKGYALAAAMIDGDLVAVASDLDVLRKALIAKPMIAQQTEEVSAHGPIRLRDDEVRSGRQSAL